MIVPSIDLMDGQAVQLIGGRERAIDGGDPFAVAERFAVAGELAVIDLDAALGRGSNADIIQALLRRYPCRVGGGIRSVDAALEWLDAGAERVILGTAATPEILAELPRDRVMAALDGVDGEVMVEGWRKGTGKTILDRVEALREFVSSFLVTFVEREGRLGGSDLEAAAAVVAAAEGVPVTIAGGITTVEEIVELDRMGADAQVGMALYSGRMDLGEAFAAPLVTDRPDGLVPTVVCDEMGQCLGLVYSSRDSIAKAIDERRGIYRSRNRGLWVKGATSGNSQTLVRAAVDCDRDAVRFTVRQHGEGFCHFGTESCWGPGRGLGALEKRVRQRLEQAPEGSYTARLQKDAELLGAKLREEAGELAAAETREEVIWETADVVYFATVAAARAGVRMRDVLAELDRRALGVRRRDGSRTDGGDS